MLHCCDGKIELIEEYALAEHSHLRAGQKAELEAHLAICQGCQRELERSIELNKKLRMIFAAQAQATAQAKADEDIEVPQEVLDRVYNNVTRAIRCKIRIKKTMRKVKIAAAVAALVVIGRLAVTAWERPALIKEFRDEPAEIVLLDEPEPRARQRHHEAPALAVTGRPTPTIRDQYEQLIDPLHAFAFLNAEYERAVESPKHETFEVLIELLQRFAETWPDYSEGIEAVKIASQCFRQIGEPYKSKQAYFEYATMLAQFLAKDIEPYTRQAINSPEVQGKIASLLLREALEIHTGQDIFVSMAYYEKIVTDFPETSAAYKAHLMLAGSFIQIGQIEKANQEYKRIISDKPDSAAAQRARIQLAANLRFAGEISESVNLLLEYSQQSTPNTDSAWGYYNAASIPLSNGEFSQGLELINTIADRYPQSIYAKASRRLLERTTSTLANSMLDSVNIFD